MKPKSAYKASVIIPVYNAEEYLRETLDCLMDQGLDFSEIEVVAVNDGSPDNSLAILNEYAAKYPNIVVLDEENGGVSVARNRGIKRATGKYLVFLDADDKLSPGSIGNIVEFFDEHYDEVDLVEYKIRKMYGDKGGALHYRYRYLTKTDVYDLTKIENWYVCVTTMNYAVKNRFEDNVLFNVDFRYHEDQLYSMDVIADKLKIGYVAEAMYLYRQHDGGVTNSQFHAYYLFDQTMEYWESFFSRYEGDIPEYFQALFLNDIGWKFRSSILLPHQYQGAEFDEQVGRIGALLRRVREDVLVCHPAIDRYHRQYFLELGSGASCVGRLAHGGYAVMCNDTLVTADVKVEILVKRMRMADGRVHIRGVIKSPLFNAYEAPALVMKSDSISSSRLEIPIRESSYSYYFTKEKCAKAYMFETTFDIEDRTVAKFFVEWGVFSIECQFVFPDPCILSDSYQRYECQKGGYVLKYDKETARFSFERIGVFKAFINSIKYSLSMLPKKKNKYAIVRLAAMLYRPRRKIWLYYDCKGVKKDNAYFQFQHDIKMNDGVKRYYITNNTPEFNNEVFGSNQKGFVSFSSHWHKLLFLRADKVITAFIEPNNCMPFSAASYSYYMDICTIPEVVYLQHGVLHAHMPWKYSFDRLLLDREVVSTQFEVENLTGQYCFPDHALIKSGMPRYDFIDTDLDSKKAILYAPSWRSYLVGNAASDFAAIDDRFLESEFYLETSSFLASEELRSMLREHGYVLDLKLHPIMRKYEHFYQEFACDCIRVGECYNDDEYRIFMTDFSSYVFDFAYLKHGILYFVPDYIKFKAGLNLYREVDLKFEDGLGAFCQTKDELLESLRDLLISDGEPVGKYREKLDGFFLHYDNAQRDRVYQALVAPAED